jgi:phosphoribosyl 1,2-cyclic phosphodiesterase
MQSSDETAVSVKFWGVRGSIATAGEEVRAAGGNTACVEIRCGPHLLLFDAGTGLRRAGLALAKEGHKRFDIFLSHSHYDHVIGLPFFAPLFDPEVQCAVWAGHTMGVTKTRDLVDALLNPLFFPAGSGMFRASVSYRDFSAGEIINPAPTIKISTAQLDHPGGVTGYRIEFDGRIITYLTDTGTQSETAKAACTRLADHADLLIYDCMYTEEEAPSRLEFGHSTWRQGVDICMGANVRHLAMFHHAPERTDDDLDRLEALARTYFAGAFIAREGVRLTLGMHGHDAALDHYA